jgi:hypothetical protein
LLREQGQLREASRQLTIVLNQEKGHAAARRLREDVAREMAETR